MAVVKAYPAGRAESGRWKSGSQATRTEAGLLRLRGEGGPEMGCSGYVGRFVVCVVWDAGAGMLRLRGKVCGVHGLGCSGYVGRSVVCMVWDAGAGMLRLRGEGSPEMGCSGYVGKGGPEMGCSGYEGGLSPRSIPNPEPTRCRKKRAPASLHERSDDHSIQQGKEPDGLEGGESIWEGGYPDGTAEVCRNGHPRDRQRDRQSFFLAAGTSACGAAEMRSQIRILPF